MFPKTGSAPAKLVTLAVFRIVELFAGALSVTVAVAMALLARVAKLNPIPLLDKFVVPEVVVAETKVVPGGNPLVSSRLVAAEGPLLVTRSVKTILLPRYTWLVEAAMPKPTSVNGVMVVSRTEELLAGVKSASAALAPGTLETVPLILAIVLIVTRAPAPLANVPMLQTTPLVLVKQAPIVLVADTNARFEGRGLVRTTELWKDLCW